MPFSDSFFAYDDTADLSDAQLGLTGGSPASLAAAENAAAKSGGNGPSTWDKVLGLAGLGIQVGAAINAQRGQRQGISTRPGVVAKNGGSGPSTATLLIAGGLGLVVLIVALNR